MTLCRRVLGPASLVLALALPWFALASDEDEIRAILDRVPKQPQDWAERWLSRSTDGDVEPMLALSRRLERREIKRLVANAPEEYKALGNNLDVARHQYLKRLIARSVGEANRRLAGKRPLARAMAVNSGGTGDFTRDQDITVFGGDALREKTLFECMRDQLVADGVLTAEEAAKVDVRTGINVERLEVSFHRGGNSLPDPRFVTDVQGFSLEYARVINAQARNPEAYYGLAYEQEVAGRQYLTFKPGTTYVQTFDAAGRDVVYTGHVARSTAEVRAHLRGAVDQRWRRSQYATHAAADYFQAVRHERAEHGTGDLTKGALKYAGRALDALVSFDAIGREDRGERGNVRPVWLRTGKESGPVVEMTREDKVELLRGIMPDKPDALLHSMSESLDVAAQVFANKADPVKKLGISEDAARTHAKIALIFMRRAVAATAGAVAQEMLDPPPYEPRWVPGYDDPRSEFNRMSAAERAERLARENETYRRATSIAAMENLLAQTYLLRQLDRPEHNPSGTTPGHDAISRMIETADARVAPLLRVAAEYANGLMAFDHGGRPETRLWGYKRMIQCQRILREAAGITEGPTVVERLTNLSGKEFVRRRRAKETFWSPAADELRQHLATIVEDSFPPTDLAGAKARIKAKGVKGYLLDRAVEETMQLSNVADLLTLVELYQQDATPEEMLRYCGTNLVSRTHWSVGFFIQAATVKDEAAVGELGKNLIFDALSRIVPPAATAKVIFDIERGIVVTTVGYALDRLNDALVDAVYTGEAGRLNDALSGHNAGKIRDGVTPVCPPAFVLKVPELDPKTRKPTGKQVVTIDRPGLYLHYLRQWGGTDEYDRDPGTRPPYSGAAGVFLKASDRVVKALNATADKAGPVWFGEEKSYVSETEVQEALEAFRSLVRKNAEEVVNASLTEILVRQFFKNGRDVIADGLRDRLVNDVICGLIDRWQTDRRSQAAAFNEAVGMAAMADLAALARSVDAVQHGRPVKLDASAIDAWAGASARPARASDLDLVVKPLAGEPGATIDAYGTAIPFTAQLVDRGGRPIDLPEVRVTLATTRIETDPPGQTIKPGVVVKHGLTATAKDAANRTLATKMIEVRVRLPDDPLARLRECKNVTVVIEGCANRSRTRPDGSSATESEHLEEAEAIRSSDHGRNGKTVRVAWSGNSFVAEESHERRGERMDLARERPLGWRPGGGSSEEGRLGIQGTVDPKKRTISFRLVKQRRSFGQQEFRVGERYEKDADGKTTGKLVGFLCSVTDLTIEERTEISARDVPAASNTRFEADGRAEVLEKHGVAFSWTKTSEVVSRATGDDKRERDTQAATMQVRPDDRWEISISFSKD